MSLATIIACFKLFLELAAFFARRVERKEIEEALLNELQIEHKKRVDVAATARDDVLAGRVPIDPADPNRRD
jgi:hypothetical protein